MEIHILRIGRPSCPPGGRKTTRRSGSNLDAAKSAEKAHLRHYWGILSQYRLRARGGKDQDRCAGQVSRIIDCRVNVRPRRRR
jgi:hypothetical protein